MLLGLIILIVKVCGDSQKFVCVVCSVWVVLVLFIVIEMLCLDEFCVIVRMFICVCFSVLNRCVVMFGCLVMLLLIVVSMLMFLLICMCCICFVDNLCVNVCSSVLWLWLVLVVCIMQQIECFDEFCEIIIIDICVWCRVVNMCFVVLGMLIRLVFFRFKRVRFGFRVRFFIGLCGECLVLMCVFGCVGWNVLWMKIGRLRWIVGDIVCGCIILVLKYVSLQVLLQFSVFSCIVLGISCGFVDSMLLILVQMCSLLVLNSVVKIVLEQLLLLWLRVVMWLL